MTYIIIAIVFFIVGFKSSRNWHTNKWAREILDDLKGMSKDGKIKEALQRHPRKEKA